MMKMAGCLLIVAATSFAGIEKAKRSRNQIEQMKYLRKILYLIQSEIRYSRLFLGEIFCQIGQKLDEPYRSWLCDMSERMSAYSGDTFESIWRRSIDKHLKVLNYPENELEALKALGNQFGFADIKVQIRLLDLYLEHLDRTINELQEGMKEKTRLYHCLGVMSGLLISVLLF